MQSQSSPKRTFRAPQEDLYQTFLAPEQMLRQVDFRLAFNPSSLSVPRAHMEAVAAAREKLRRRCCRR